MDQSEVKYKRHLFSFRHNAKNIEGAYVPFLAGVLIFYSCSFIYTINFLGQMSQLYATGEIASKSIPYLIEQNKILAILLFINFLINLIVVYYFFNAIYIRVAGAIVAVTNQIKLIKENNFKIRRTLRGKDELVVVMSDLHDLSKTLENKSK